MAVTHLPTTDADDRRPPLADSIGGWGWLSIFAIFMVAILLVANI